MSFDYNSTTYVGGVTRDPELRMTGNNTPVLQLGIAVNHSRKVNGEWVDEPNFLDITAFGSLAENVSESIGKGDRVIVVGRATWRAWEKDGDKRSKVEFVASSIGPDLTRATAEITKISREDG